MDVVSENDIIVLTMDYGKPQLSAGWSEGILVIHEGLKTMRLGATSVKFLADSLSEFDGSYVRAERKLEYDGRIALHVFSESGWVYIQGANCRFNMRSEVAERFAEWLGESNSK